MSLKSHTMSMRIYYKDTDHGGVVYYARYLDFMEVARTELLRSLGISPQDLIADYGIVCPVAEVNVRYKKSAVYDDTIKIVSEVKEISAVRLVIEYQIFNSNSELLIQASTTNCGVDQKTFKLVQFPPEFLSLFK